MLVRTLVPSQLAIVQPGQLYWEEDLMQHIMMLALEIVVQMGLHSGVFLV